MEKEKFQDYSPEKFHQLEEDLNKLNEMMRLFSENPKNQSLKPEIRKLLQEMHGISQVIGGKILDHTNDLRIDINLFLENPENLKMTPKIFQDFQFLKNDIRSL